MSAEHAAQTAPETAFSPAASAAAPPPETSAGKPAFDDLGQSIGVAWDVWLATRARAQQRRYLVELRLKKLVELARERSRFYRKLYRSVRADECRVAQLPVVTKGELMAHFDAAVTDPRVTRAGIDAFIADERRAGQLFLDRYAVWTSSGTTGEPGIFVHDPHALAVYEALEIIRFRQLDLLALLPAALAGDRYAVVGATGGHFVGNATAERLRLLHPWLASRLRVFSILDPLPALVRALNAYQPTLLSTYPTAASLLAEAQRAGRLSIRLREIWSGGEQLSPAERARIAEAFGCRVRDDYGASEFRAIGWGCMCGALHVNADWVLLEPVDERYRPVPPGVPSHSTLLTNLANRVQPLIRYDLGDSITVLDRPCECGSPLPAIRVEGRCDDVLTMRDAAGRTVKLLPLALVTVLEEGAEVFRFQLIQAAPTKLLLLLDPAGAGSDAAMRCRHALGDFLRAHGLSNVHIDIEVRALKRHAVSGKLRRILAKGESV